MKMQPGPWQDNPNLIVQLRDLWDEGHSVAEIGRRLGVSKNSIAGKVHRLDLPPRPSPIKHGITPKQDTRIRVVKSLPALPSLYDAYAVAAAEIRAERQAEFKPRVVLTHALPSMAKTCQWIDGHPHTRNYTFCGDATTHGSSYCAIHHRRCFIPLIRREYAA